MYKNRAEVTPYPKGSIGGAHFAIQRIHTLFNNVTRRDEYVIQGVQESAYKELNGKRCIEYKSKLTRFKRYKNGTTVKDAKQQKVLEHISVPHDATPILSNVTVANAKQLYNDKRNTGCRFIDVVNLRNVNYSRYIIPTKYLYKVNLVSLVVSANHLRNHLGGITVYTVDNAPLYVFIVPYKSTNVNYNIFVSESLTDLQSMQLNFLQSLFLNGIIVDYTLLNLNGDYLTYKAIYPTISEFTSGISPISLADMKDQDDKELSLIL